MQSRGWQMRMTVAVLVVAVTGCAGESLQSPATEPREARIAAGVHAGSAARRDSMLTVYAEYSAQAPGDRVARLRALGADVALDVGHDHYLAALVPAPLVEKVRQLPWITNVTAIQRHPVYFGRVEAPRLSTILRGMNLFADSVPDGMATIRADLVQDGLLVRGAGAKLGIIDHLPYCDHQDLAGVLTGSGYNRAYNLRRPGISGCKLTEKYHGTAVTGVTSALINGTGYRGVASSATTYSYGVCEDAITDPCFLGAIPAALDSAIAHGVDVVNMSVGDCLTPLTSQELAAFERAYQAGVTVVVAASYQSNCPGGEQNVYAAAPHVMAVTAHGAGDYGLSPGMIVSGAAIAVAGPYKTQAPVHTYGSSGWADFAGTSGTAPEVAGTIALLRSAGFPRNPDLLRTRIRETVRPLQGGFGYDFGALDAANAVKLRPTVPQLNAPTFVGGGQPVTMTASQSDTMGVGPFEYSYLITTPPSVPFLSTWSAWKQGPHTVTLPAGNYTATVYTKVREVRYQREGTTYSVGAISVTSSGGCDPALRGGVTPDCKAGQCCGGDPL